jgi:hypothetical protein
MTKSIYSIKSTMRPLGRDKVTDGPWKPTFDAAVGAFVEMLKKKGVDTLSVRDPFVAVRCEDDGGCAKDARGNCYKGDPNLDKTLSEMLAKEGISTLYYLRNNNVKD